jgi:hypothetical protein
MGCLSDYFKRISKMKNYVYHMTRIGNVDSILKDGLIPSHSYGLMNIKDNKSYFTDSLKYMDIMAKDILSIDEYCILKIMVRNYSFVPIWWEGKKYHEWSTKNRIKPEDISVFKIRKML